MVAGSIARPRGRRKKKGRPRKPPGHVPPSKQYRRKRCDAYARTTGKPCKRWAMTNGRCMMHGGKTPKGGNHPAFKTGERSKYLISTVEQFLRDDPLAAEDLLNMDLCGIEDEVRLTAGMLMLYIHNRPRVITGDWIIIVMRLLSKLTVQKQRCLRMQKHKRSITLGELQDIIKRFSILVLTAFDETVGDERLSKRFGKRVGSMLKDMTFPQPGHRR